MLHDFGCVCVSGRLSLDGQQMEPDMTYREILIYQERTMNDMLCACWIGMRSDREHMRQALIYLRYIIRTL